MTAIIDFHTHAFPDTLAQRAMEHLTKQGNIPAFHQGTISALLESMDKTGIEKSIICSIATKPNQFRSILNWSKSIASDRIIPFPSFHPDDPKYADNIKMIKDAGFKGIKFHPYYQEFNLDDEKMFPIYEHIATANLILLSHTGFDFAFPFIRKADPEKILNVLSRVPELKLICSHLGAWKDWDNVECLLVGKPLYMEISFALDFLEFEQAKRIIVNHPHEYILFGTDSPWTDQKKTLHLLKSLSLDPTFEQMILYGNAMRLLNSVS
ncbi:MAG: amidohydrolase family protein [bacterium]|nr:amidohydrolase family protein [bacterium]